MHVYISKCYRYQYLSNQSQKGTKPPQKWASKDWAPLGDQINNEQSLTVRMSRVTVLEAARRPQQRFDSGQESWRERMSPCSTGRSPREAPWGWRAGPCYSMGTEESVGHHLSEHPMDAAPFLFPPETPNRRWCVQLPQTELCLSQTVFLSFS